MGHHYVPRFYLKKFAFNEENTLVYSMTKEGMTNENAIGDICQKTNYNSQKQELQQKQIEDHFSHVVRKFIKDPNPGNSKLSLDFLKFLCFMMGNNVYYRKQISQLLSKMELVLEDSGSEYAMPIANEYRRRLDLSLSFAHGVFEAFKNWSFVNCWVVNNERVHITSDNPVSLLSPENIFMSENINIEINEYAKIGNVVNDNINPIAFPFTFNIKGISLNKDLMMIFPVSPNLCVIGFSDSERHMKFGQLLESNQMINFVNIITLHQCNRAVYSHSKECLNYSKDDKHNFFEYCNQNKITPSFEVAMSWL